MTLRKTIKHFRQWRDIHGVHMILTDILHSHGFWTIMATPNRFSRMYSKRASSPHITILEVETEK
jgi:exopolysaccharide biosynthesis predicted pyruvyltransferase EpsI